MALHGQHLDKHRRGLPGFVTGEVSVGGFVKRPGPVDFGEGMTLGDAIKAAGGATPFGSARRVQLLRDGKRYIYDMRNPTHRQVGLMAGDSISVPQKIWIGK